FQRNPCSQRNSLQLQRNPCSFNGIPAASTESLQLQRNPCSFNGIPATSSKSPSVRFVLGQRSRARSSAPMYQASHSGIPTRRINASIDISLKLLIASRTIYSRIRRKSERSNGYSLHDSP